MKNLLGEILLTSSLEQSVELVFIFELGELGLDGLLETQRSEKWTADLIRMVILQV